jgi:hypothetical protein
MAPPLAVDLDGTLIRGDLFTAAMIRLVNIDFWMTPLLLVWLMRGRAHAKAKLAKRYPPDVTTLSYDQRIVTWLTLEHTRGRVISLATAYDQGAAEAIAAHLGLFDHVFASDGHINLKSHRKAERLRAAFPDGFAYAGNERADLAVWRAAVQAVVVNAPVWLERRAAAEFVVERVFPRERKGVAPTAGEPHSGGEE